MRCRLCESTNQYRFIGEMGIRFPGLRNIDKPTVWVFPKLIVCLHCGLAEFVLPEGQLNELCLLGGGDVAASA
jgi:hypothetical protein